MRKHSIFFICFLVLFFWPSTVRAITTEYESVSLKQTVVSPRRFVQNTEDAPENIEVLTKDDLYLLTADDPGEALSYIPGVDVTPRTKFGHFTPLSIQGSASRHVLVMIDGIPFNTEASGQADVLPELPLGNLERIEVIKGSASSAWGYSLGGVVNLITKDTGHTPVPHGHLMSAWSGFDATHDDFEANGAIGPMGYYFSGEYQDAGGTRAKTGALSREDTLRKNFFGKLSYPLSDILKATASFGYIGAEVNEGLYSDGTRTDVPYFSRYGQMRLESDKDDRNHLEAAFKFNRQLIHYNTLDGITDDLLSIVDTRDHYYGIEIKNVAKFRQEDTLILGYDISQHILKSNQMDIARDVLVQAPYVNYSLWCRPFEILGGLRYDINDEFGSQLNPNIGAVYFLPEKSRTRLRFNVNRAFSAPPLLWKYFRDVFPGLTGNNPDIKPESAWVYEAGIETEWIPRLLLKFSVYRSDISNAINTTVNSEGLFIKENFEKFRQQGFEFESKARLSREVTSFFAVNFNDVEDRATRLTVRNRGVTRPSFRGGFDIQLPDGFEAVFTGRYDRWDSSPSLQPNDRKFIFDGKISKTIKNAVKGIDITGFMNVYNLTNSKYWSDKDFPLPQRYFEVGIRMDF